MSEADELWSRSIAALTAHALFEASILDRAYVPKAIDILSEEIAARLALNDRPVPFTWLISAIADKRLNIIEQANGMYRFSEETEMPGDQYTGQYFAPTHVSGLYVTAEDAERDARSELPGLRLASEV